MDEVTQFLSSDHDRLDGIFLEFRAQTPAQPAKGKAAFDAFDAGLRRHIEWEETLLFPAFERVTGMAQMGPTAVMRSEHSQIKGLLAEIARRLTRGESGWEPMAESLLVVLKAHNDKEENILYPWIDRSLSDGERQDMLGQMKPQTPR